MRRKNAIIAIIIAAAIVIIATSITLAVVLTKSSSATTDKNNSSDTPVVSSSVDDEDPLTPHSSNDTSNANNPTTTIPSTIPPPQKITPPDMTNENSISLLAIGDWGATQEKYGSCCQKHRTPSPTSQEHWRDYHSQLNIGKLLAASAAELKPAAILGHGDNVYWNGLFKNTANDRMDYSFKNIYNRESLKNIPWYNVIGNHDLGGSSYLCGDGPSFRKCRDADDLVYYLNLKFTLQRDYDRDNRWNLKDHYYKESFKANGVSVDVFNVDTNYADSHAANQVCCQCFAYSGKDSAKCAGVVHPSASEYCAGGDVKMFNACMNTIKGWWDQSVTGIKADLQKSTATYKVINTHYSPHFHMGEPKMKLWYDICNKYGVHIWLNGHTHGFNHDVPKYPAMKTHFFENGGGGGIQSQSSGRRPPIAAKYIDTNWVGTGDSYGFFELTFSKSYARVQFVTFDSKWVFKEDASSVIEGGIGRDDFCWLVPEDPSTGIGGSCLKK